MPTRRPNVLLWLYYQYSGKLPTAYREWVLHDGTCKTWMLRVLVRGLLRIAPIAVVMFGGLVVYGGAWPLAMGSVLLGVLVAVRISLTGAAESVDARLSRHGYPSAYGSSLRSKMDETAAERYRAVWRQTGD